MKLEKLGYTDWFKSNTDSNKLDAFQIARITTVFKDKYFIHTGQNSISAEISGKLMFTADSPLDYPTVGDWVYIQSFDNNSFAIIDGIVPRKTILKRKSSGRKIDVQLIAANIDCAFIIQSLNEDFNINRLERYLVMVQDENIQAIVLLSKCDLISQADTLNQVNLIQSRFPGMDVIPFSNTNFDGLEQINLKMKSGLTYCLLGSSGVGKTTFLNSLLGVHQFDTQSIREKDGKGKHTTSHRQLVSLENGAMIVDTPGMRELGNLQVNSGFKTIFDDILELSKQCLYSDCSHTSEKGCAVQKAIKTGKLLKDHFDNYTKMHKETLFNEMSYLEKRNRDKAFGKMIKSVKKSRRKP
ncbi:MAG: ribosome small subunit-dependent GTPase A [Deltaproteobacteria bacterium]|jgi:ribosome biogenesis GTPase / thiamine phosphate phosphatase|nr:ribosome small subunit-dependent GTPase A [Deltaproteobacteria bacterium]MBT4527395.1 ribosome small subunit-dependent GTPase A [Deltaproteobacteria bacterium]